MPSALTVSFEIVADSGALRNTDVLVQDGTAQLGMASDVAVVHDDAAFDEGTGVNVDAASENRLAHHAAGKNAPARDDAVDRLAAAIFFVEDELSGRIGIARSFAPATRGCKD